MNRFSFPLLLTIFSLCFLLSCNASKSILVAQADKPPMLPLVKPWTRPQPPTADNRLQVFLYGNCKYPQIAREPGVQGSFRANYVVTDKGEVINLKVLEVAFDEIFPTISPSTSNTLLILSYQVFPTEQSRGKYILPPLPDFTYSDTLKGQRALLHEVERVVDLLPDFNPARSKGRPVSVRMNTTFIFRLE